MPRMHHRLGFTLIELLVVIAILAILAAILFPVFAGAREKARQTLCLSNARQIIAGIQMYAQDYAETLPAAATFAACLTSDYGLSGKVWDCPSSSRKGTPADADYIYPRNRSGIALGDLPQPTGTVLLGDGHSSDPNHPNTTSSAGDFDLRHKGKMVAGYADGHVTVINRRPHVGEPVIAFFSERDGNNEIYRMQPDGSGLLNLTNHPANDSCPGWCLSTGMVAFTSDRDGNNEIYLMGGDGSSPARLTNDTANDELPDCAPDGSKIAFESNRDGNWDIYLMNPDGSGVLNLTHNPGDDMTPKFSRDGTQIAFYSNRDGGACDIYMMNADGTNLRRLTTNPADDIDPSFSPDGSMIVFSTNRGGTGYELHTMSATGGGSVRMVGLNLGMDSYPVFNPDGDRIAFTAQRDGSWDIFTIGIDGSQLTRLTTAPGKDYCPTWGLLW
jgi:prepilin-type N-terminal cleavage/methylation domain-containing protein/prepilin-type processing-associated H-X9-DG protein